MPLTSSLNSLFFSTISNHSSLSSFLLQFFIISTPFLNNPYSIFLPSSSMPFPTDTHSQMSYSIGLIAPSLSYRNLFQIQPLFISLSCSILLLLYLSSCRILNRIVSTHFPNIGFCYCSTLSSSSRHFPTF